jgi:hypothetical protein
MPVLGGKRVSNNRRENSLIGDLLFSSYPPFPSYRTTLVFCSISFDVSFRLSFSAASSNGPELSGIRANKSASKESMISAASSAKIGRAHV